MEGGDKFKIVCPFHADINPSLLVSLSTGSWYCFGCGLSGNAYDFVRLLFPKLSDLECLKAYYKILKSRKVKRLKFRRKKDKLYKQTNNKQALIEAEDFYFGLKTINWIVENNPEKQYMRDRGFLPSSLNKCQAKLTYNVNYPIVFPMFDLGQFKGWVCRTTTPRIEKKRKYLYNKGFSRRDTLVGNYQAKTVVLVEGYMDRLKLLQFGVKHATAILGWKVTEQQIVKLKNAGVKTIISALDNDQCGEKGTLVLKQYFKVVRFVFPSGCKDPGDLTREKFKIAKLKTVRRMHSGKS